MKLLITGASGKLGRATIDHLLRQVDAADLILATRSPQTLADYAARGARVVEADFTKPEGLAHAFAGADRMLLISTDALGQREPQHRAAIEAAVSAGVKFIAYTSFPSFGTDDPLSLEHAATEQQLRESGLQWCVLKNFPYADNEIDALREALEAGEIATSTEAGETAFVSRDDCAAVAAAVLTGTGHEGHTYDVTGPELIDAARRAQIFTEVGQQPIAVRHVDDATASQELSAKSGLPLFVALDIVSSVATATRSGVFAVQSDSVERLTGNPATPLRAVLEHARHH
ncbi:NAD(P)H-binding protein [Salinibacterium hongtaonis]|uniref:NAD(P)-dependent oxidoreductase n=1 Tax=Homoserinimonas hongtaonis TaxID=2079791 RepID=A0A2U1T1K3_9MICO|nr:NAD(P)H-binding protein [Salinibacterium hongtaonis]PWB97761.1 NAD(P)-dependent oxidoreductase [Salinibacterium hongtaonis]